MGGKRHGEQHEDDSPDWSVSRAARAATALQDEITDAVPQSRILLQSMVTAGNESYQQTFRLLIGRGHSRRDAHRGAVVMANQHQLDPQVLGSGQPIVDNARLLLHRDVETVGAADLFVVSPVMHAMAIAAAETLADDDLRLWREDDLPTLTGFVLFPEAVRFQHRGGLVPDELAGLSWRTGTAHVQGDDGPQTPSPAVFATAWLDVAGDLHRDRYQQALAQARQLGERYPSVLPGHYSYCVLDAADSTPLPDPEVLDAAVVPSAEVVGEYSGDAVTGHAISVWIPKYLFALSRLLQQPKQATERRYGEGVDSRARPRPHHDVRVIQARAVTPVDGEAGHRGGTRTYSHRFTVRMHKVNQRYPKQGVNRIIWRGPYIKGPSEAPMLPGRKVHRID